MKWGLCFLCSVTLFLLHLSEQNEDTFLCDLNDDRFSALTRLSLQARLVWKRGEREGCELWKGWESVCEVVVFGVMYVVLLYVYKQWVLCRK